MGNARVEALSENTASKLNERAEFLAQPSVMLGLIPYLDGDSWCVLYGEDIQVGICGFGDTPAQAMREFDKVWNWGNNDS